MKRLVLKNIVGWFLVHMIVSIGVALIPTQQLRRIRPYFRNFRNEADVLKRYLHIRRWKDQLPESSQFLFLSYDKSHFNEHTEDLVERFLLEVNRAELTHWLSMAPFPLFFLWNPPRYRAIHVVYAVISNLPFILVQRYNRIRLERVLKKMNQRHSKMP